METVGRPKFQGNSKKMILLQGQASIWPPGEAARAALNSIEDLDYLESLVLRLLEVSSWEELLQQR